MFDINVIMADFGGKCKTVGGDDVEILKTNVRRADNCYPIAGVVTCSDGLQEIHSWSANGRYQEDTLSPTDLVMPTPRIERWAVISPNGNETDTFGYLIGAKSKAMPGQFIEHRVIENGVLTVEVVQVPE